MRKAIADIRNLNRPNDHLLTPHPNTAELDLPVGFIDFVFNAERITKQNAHRAFSRFAVVERCDGEQAVNTPGSYSDCVAF
jgi:hypothetical protein